MTALASICVYCGSGTGTDPAYEKSARVLGYRLAEAGIGLVYGGGSIGLMGALARAVLDAGGAVTGIIPRFLLERELLLDGLTETIVTDNMHQRKMLMFERAGAFAALPGGVGTLEELVEQLTWVQLGQHEKPIALVNIAGFWDPLIGLFEKMRREGLIRPGLEVPYLVVDRAEDVVPALTRAAALRAPSPREAVEPLRRM
jgi:uncharacterized protein (TIGR00730 family)